MVRIFSKPDGTSAPRIDRQSVATFFKERASKAQHLGHVQAVIYQDKYPDLARQRDVAEKEKLLPLLRLNGNETVLDVGCGTGRWADVIVPLCGRYVGTDFSQELVDIATARFASAPRATFMCMPAEMISSKTLAVRFQVILSMGLFMYLNDDELVQTIQGYASVADSCCRILIREPIGIESRLTIKEHYSEDMDQIYNAIYRTEDELMAVIRAELTPAGFNLIDSGDVYEAALNNRSDTTQKWFLLEK
jgi:SAM-dependent methyltransferase